MVAWMPVLFKKNYVNKKEAIRLDDFFFGDPERTRTVDLQRDRLAC